MSRKPGTVIRTIVSSEIECSPKSYWRAATQRLDVAKFLLKNSRYYLDAIYLAGYAAECSLKSLILGRTLKSKRAAVRQEISSGAKAHSLDFLAGVLGREHFSIPDQAKESLNVLKYEWTTNLRYVGAVIPNAEAKNFIKHVELLCQWVERSK